MKNISNYFVSYKKYLSKGIFRKVAVISILFTLSYSSLAENDYVKPIPLLTITDNSNGDGIVQSWGINYESSPAYRGSDQYNVEFQIGGALQYRNGNHLFFLEGFNIDGVEVGWRSMVTDNTLLQLGARHETVLPTSHLKAGVIKGIEHRGSEVLAFVEGSYLFGKDETYWLTGRLSGGPSEFGYRAKFSAGYQFSRPYNNTGLGVVAYSTFAAKEQVNKYFGISPDESVSSGLAQSDLDGGYRSSGVEILYRQNFFKNIQILARVGVEVYSNDIKESALVSEDAEITTSVSAVWRFW